MEHPVQAGPDSAEPTSVTTDVDLSLETLVSRLLADDPALAQSLGRLDLRTEQLLKLIQPREADIRRSATSEAEALSVAEAQLKRASSGVPPEESRRILLRGYTKLSILLVASVASGAIIGLSFIFLAFLQPILWALAGVIEASAIASLLARWLNERFNAAKRLERNEYISGLGTDALKAKVDTARETLARALMSRGIRPIIVQLRAERDQTAYTTRLRYISARGLSEVYDPAIFELETPSFQQVRRLLDNTPGGSIGLAGPRGTGKTTVMSSFVAGRTRRSDGKRGRAIRVSAPVDYVARDFILHLFAELCESVLVPEPPFLRPSYASQPIRRIRSFSYRYAAQISVVIAWILLIWGLFLLLDAIFRFSFDSRYLIGPVLIVASAGIAYLGQRSVRMSARDEERHYREEMELRDRAAYEAQASSAQAREGVSAELGQLASKYLDVIRFQQTYTDGWSGSLTASAGIVQGTAGITGGASYLRNLLSLPDIVAFFKEFVAANVADGGPVIIGIDELDKIEKGDKAQDFLNDIKSVFGVDQCYFLISISEDALANFERRGLPVRDAFDSALDDVVRVNPLDYSTALRLIRIRIVGLPEPYAALIYCLSGGLPRDLIRWARAFIVARDTAGEELAALCKIVLRDDLERKVSASIVALSNDSGAAADTAIRVVGSLRLSTEPSWLLDRCDEILSSKVNDELQHPSEPTPGDEKSQVFLSGLGTADVVSRRVLSQLFGYFYFAATIIEVFTNDLSEGQFAQLISDDGLGTVSQLAHARQCFTSNPWLAIDEISSFRAARKLKRRLSSSESAG